MNLANARLALLGLLLALAAVAAAVGRASSAPDPARIDAPRYDQRGRLLRPEGYETWVFVGASLGLGYGDTDIDSGGANDSPGMFHHVYLHPEAYATFARTGAFPDGTMLVLEMHAAGTDAPPRRAGYFEGARMAVEVAVKDPARFADGWAYFDFSGGAAAARPFASRQCHACHREHAATDNVFTQFYPVLRRARGGG